MAKITKRSIMSFRVALCLNAFALILIPIVSGDSLRISADAGATWPVENLSHAAGTVSLPVPSQNQRLPLHARTADARARTNLPAPDSQNPEHCRAIAVVQWRDTEGGQPFGLGWKLGRGGVACADASTGRQVVVETVDSFVDEIRPRWSSFRYSQTVEDLAETERKLAATRDKRPWWRQPNNFALGLAIFAIVALGHGIYLGATAVAEDEAAEQRRREEQLSQLRTLAKAAPAGRIKVTAPKPRKRKGNSKKNHRPND